MLITRKIINTGNPLCAPDGTPLANVRVSFTLVGIDGKPTSVFDTDTHERIVGSKYINTDANGEFPGVDDPKVLKLFPNNRGDKASFYKCHVHADGVADIIAVVPPGNTPLTWAEFYANGTPLTPQQIDLVTLLRNSITTVLYGAGAPASGTGADGYFYIDTTAHAIYGPKAAGAWPAGVALIGPAGANGADGAAGANGANGVDGNTVLYGAGAPAGGTGVNGNFYIDTTAHAIYGPKAAGAWPAGVALITLGSVNTFTPEGDIFVWGTEASKFRMGSNSLLIGSMYALVGEVCRYFSHNVAFDSATGNHLGRDDTGTCQLEVWTETGIYKKYSAVNAAAGVAPVWVQQRNVEAKATVAIVAGVLTLDLSSADIFDVTLNANITSIVLTNPPASPNGSGWSLHFIGDGTQRSIVYPASFKPAGGIFPTPTATAGKEDTIVITTDDGGATYSFYNGGQNR